jgi:hypothetical protein
MPDTDRVTMVYRIDHLQWHMDPRIRKDDYKKTAVAIFTHPAVTSLHHSYQA